MASVLTSGFCSRNPDRATIHPTAWKGVLGTSPVARWLPSDPDTGPLDRTPPRRWLQRGTLMILENNTARDGSQSPRRRDGWQGVVVRRVTRCLSGRQTRRRPALAPAGRDEGSLRDLSSDLAQGARLPPHL